MNFQLFVYAFVLIVYSTVANAELILNCSLDESSGFRNISNLEKQIELVKNESFSLVWDNVSISDSSSAFSIICALPSSSTLNSVSASLAAGAESMLLPATSCKAVETSNTVLLKSQESGLVNSETETSIPVVCPINTLLFNGLAEDILKVTLRGSTENPLASAVQAVKDYCNLSEKIYNEGIGLNSESEWTCTPSQRKLVANGIPNHEVGTFPNSSNPNTIGIQDIRKAFDLNPELVSTSGEFVKRPGYGLNGVLFEPQTDAACTDSGACVLVGGTGFWNIEAQGHDTFSLGLDMNNAHVQPNGTYHYHGTPERYIELLASSSDNPQILLMGWALDGFPIYARYGYSNATDSSTEVKLLRSSWQLKPVGDTGRPLITNKGVTISMGTFTQDYEYVEGSGDLDKCNGRYGVTPEFPEGVYHYIVTDDFPYISRCLRGRFNY